jgi:hypothetical protein
MCKEPHLSGDPETSSKFPNDRIRLFRVFGFVGRTIVGNTSPGISETGDSGLLGCGTFRIISPTEQPGSMIFCSSDIHPKRLVLKRVEVPLPKQEIRLQDKAVLALLSFKVLVFLLFMTWVILVTMPITDRRRYRKSRKTNRSSPRGSADQVGKANSSKTNSDKIFTQDIQAASDEHQVSDNG